MKGLIIIIIILCAQLCIAQEIVDIEKIILRGKQDIQRAVDADDINQLMATRNHFIDLLSSNQHKQLIHYYIGYIDYQLFDNYMSKKDKKNAKKYIYDGIENLEKAVELKDDFADGYALLSSMYMQKAGVKRLSVIGSMKKAFGFTDKALKFAPENPRVLLYAGILNSYMPSVFGANKEDGFKYIQKSIECFKAFKPQEPVYPEHGFVLAYMSLGNIHMGRGDLDEAQTCFDNVLNMAPENNDVKELIAKLDEKKRARTIGQ